VDVTSSDGSGHCETGSSTEVVGGFTLDTFVGEFIFDTVGGSVGVVSALIGGGVEISVSFTLGTGVRAGGVFGTEVHGSQFFTSRVSGSRSVQIVSAFTSGAFVHIVNISGAVRNTGVRSTHFRSS